MKSYNLTEKDWQQNCWIVDAENKVFGRLASKIANILMGKHTAKFQPGWNRGDKVYVINADKVKITGDKLKKKIYRWYTGYPGGLKEVVMEKMLNKKPDYALVNAIKGMLPHNSRGRKLFKNLRIVNDKTKIPSHAKEMDLKI